MGYTSPVVSIFQLIKLNKNTTSVTLTVWDLHPPAIPHSNPTAQQSVLNKSQEKYH